MLPSPDGPVTWREMRSAIAPVSVDRGIHTSAPWPYASLDVTSLCGDSWQPVALREFVIKIHQRCNLACSYCYVYTMADQSWRTRPGSMSDQVLDATAAAIADHAARHGLDEVSVVLHGGEPILLGPGRIVEIARRIRAAVAPVAAVRLAIQTNGTLLDDAMLAALLEEGIRVGISLDGPPASHDRHRRYADGRGTFPAVERALRLLSRPDHRHLFSGVLATIDRDVDPVECYEALLVHSPPAVGLLLPHANWAAPPAPTGRAGWSYGEWLIRVFDRWYDASRQETRVPLFEEIMNAVLGGAVCSESVGLSPAAVAVIETDGAIEQSDALKSAYDGAASLGLSVLTDSFDDALHHPGILARQIGVAALCKTCQACPIHQICGAGHYAHRYRAGAGFRNPSVYCADLQQIIGHIRLRVLDDLAARFPVTV